MLVPPPPQIARPPRMRSALVPQVTEDQRYALLEYVSHLTAKDYEVRANAYPDTHNFPLLFAPPRIALN
jgi:hypothetical protein